MWTHNRNIFWSKIFDKIKKKYWLLHFTIKPVSGLKVFNSQTFRRGWSALPLFGLSGELFFLDFSWTFSCYTLTIIWLSMNNCVILKLIIKRHKCFLPTSYVDYNNRYLISYVSCNSLCVHSSAPDCLLFTQPLLTGQPL